MSKSTIFRKLREPYPKLTREEMQELRKICNFSQRMAFLFIFNKYDKGKRWNYWENHNCPRRVSRHILIWAKFYNEKTAEWAKKVMERHTQDKIRMTENLKNCPDIIVINKNAIVSGL